MLCHCELKPLSCDCNQTLQTQDIVTSKSKPNFCDCNETLPDSCNCCGKTEDACKCSAKSEPNYCDYCHQCEVLDEETGPPDKQDINECQKVQRKNGKKCKQKKRIARVNIAIGTSATDAQCYSTKITFESADQTDSKLLEKVDELGNKISCFSQNFQVGSEDAVVEINFEVSEKNIQTCLEDCPDSSSIPSKVSKKNIQTCLEECPEPCNIPSKISKKNIETCLEECPGPCNIPSKISKKNFETCLEDCPNPCSIPPKVSEKNIEPCEDDCPGTVSIPPKISEKNIEPCEEDCPGTVSIPPKVSEKNIQTCKEDCQGACSSIPSKPIFSEVEISVYNNDEEIEQNIAEKDSKAIQKQGENTEKTKQAVSLKTIISARDIGDGEEELDKMEILIQCFLEKAMNADDGVFNALFEKLQAELVSLACKCAVTDGSKKALTETPRGKSCNCCPIKELSLLDKVALDPMRLSDLFSNSPSDSFHSTDSSFCRKLDAGVNTRCKCNAEQFVQTFSGVKISVGVSCRGALTGIPDTKTNTNNPYSGDVENVKTKVRMDDKPRISVSRSPKFIRSFENYTIKCNTVDTELDEPKIVQEGGVTKIFIPFDM